MEGAEELLTTNALAEDAAYLVAIEVDRHTHWSLLLNEFETLISTSFDEAANLLQKSL